MMKAKYRKVRFASVAMCFAALVFLMVWGCVPGGTPDPGPTPDYDTFNAGPFATTQNLRSGPSNNSGLFYPSGAGTAGQKFPIFLWGCGGGSDPSDYTFHMNRIASHGFVVVAEVSSNTGRELTRALDWLIQENENSRSPLYQKLDIDGTSTGGGCNSGTTTTNVNVASGGHSMGSVATFAIADDPRLKTTIHVAGGSFDGNGPRKLRNPTAYLAGENDSLATSNVERDYRNTTVPVFKTVMSGVGHVDAAREGLPAMIAWLRWHLKGETERSGDFLNRNAVFTTGKWVSQSKNW